MLRSCTSKLASAQHFMEIVVGLGVFWLLCVLTFVVRDKQKHDLCSKKFAQ